MSEDSLARGRRVQLMKGVRMSPIQWGNSYIHDGNGNILLSRGVIQCDGVRVLRSVRRILEEYWTWEFSFGNGIVL